MNFLPGPHHLGLRKKVLVVNWLPRYNSKGTTPAVVNNELRWLQTMARPKSSIELQLETRASAQTVRLWGRM